jgi:Flp pilus assembly protein TadG
MKCPRGALDSRRRGPRSGRRGQSLVEVAVALPILLVILAAIVDLGRAIDAYITITNGAREGARYGALHPNDEGNIALRTVNEANGSGTNLTAVNLTTDNVSVVFPDDGARWAGATVRVTVNFVMPMYFGGMVGLFELPIHKSADMEIIYSSISPPLTE